jgi:hypothetical protein
MESVLWFIFAFPDGILISGFAIDLIMAVMFLVNRERLSPELKVPIALFKLIGDLCGGIYYGRNSGIVAIIAAMVLLCNGCYLWLCCRDRNAQRRMTQSLGLFRRVYSLTFTPMERSWLRSKDTSW